MFVPKSSNQRRVAFTLMELLIVVAIIGILSALLLPVVGAMTKRAALAKSSSNLHQIGVAFQMYAGDNDGRIPATENKDPNYIVGPEWGDSNPWWSQLLSRYVGGKDFPRRWEIPDEPFTDPYYRLLVGKSQSPGWRGGYSMNDRVNLVRNENFGRWNANSSRYVQYRLANIRGDSVLVTMSYSEGFAPKDDGTIEDERFSQGITTPVPHNKRIGANNKGVGGKSALYLFADGSVKNLVPDDAKEFLKLRQ